MNLRREIQEILGATYKHALFYNFPGGLRFELSEGGSPLDQVLIALRKATAICDDVFDGADRILAHLRKFVPASRFQLRPTLRELQLAGVTIPKDREIWLEKMDEGQGGDDDECWLNCAFEIPKSKLQNLLWCALTTDFPPIRPNPRCRVYLLNPDKGIIVHPYDDRGMDVVSRQKSALAGLYERHNDLLLDYDIEAMRQTFAQS